MSRPTHQEFITKKEVEELFGRSHRALTRDISTAIRVGDREILTHLKLRTDNEQEYAGIDVTLELIQNLSNNGLSPTWYISRTFAAERYGSRSGRQPASPNGSRTTASKDEPPSTSENARPATDSELVQVLKDQLKKSHDAHENDKNAFRDQLQMLKDMFDTLKDDHNDTKDLLREVHKVMDKLADIRLLGATTSTSSADKAKPASSHPQPIVEATILKASKSSHPAEPARPKPIRTKPATKTASAPTRPPATKKKPQSTGRAKVAPTTPKQSRKTIPTKKQATGNKSKPDPKPDGREHQARKSRWYEKMARFLSSDD